MAPFLGFIRDRHSQQPSETTQQKPETAKEKSSRQAREEMTPPVSSLSSELQTKAREIGAEVRQATQELSTSKTAPTPAPAPADSNPEAMRQKMMQQENAAPALSPTTAHHGIAASEKEHEAPKAQEKDKQISRPQTVARAQPSWER